MMLFYENYTYLHYYSVYVKLLVILSNFQATEIIKRLSFLKYLLKILMFLLILFRARSLSLLVLVCGVCVTACDIILRL